MSLKIHLASSGKSIHNFSQYKLTPEEEHALSFSLDNHIPTKQNDIKIKTKFESFYYQILKHTNQLDQRRQDELKSKIRRTSENYSRIKVPYKYQKIIDNISRNKDIILIKQDKGRGVVILDKKDYIEKCINITDSKQFKKLKEDPTKTENKMQHTLRKIKHNILTKMNTKECTQQVQNQACSILQQKCTSYKAERDLMN